MEYLLLLLTALWLGLVTSFSPCALPVSVAALSFIANNGAGKKDMILSGALYIAGRCITYTVIAFLIVWAVFKIPDASIFLSLYINKVLGIIFIMVGMHLLKLFPVNLPAVSIPDFVLKRAGGKGALGPLFTGMVLALAFCPVATALFFGSLLPMVLKTQANFALPVAFGIGTGLPVLIFSALLAGGAHYLNSAGERFSHFGNYIKSFTGVIIFLIGIYYVLKYLFMVI